MTPEDVLNAAAAPDLASIGSTHTASALAAVVLRDGAVVVEHAAGHAGFDPQRPLTLETPFDLASVTKVFTATLAMLAVDAGRCAIDEPIVRWVDDWVDGAEAVTLLHLLNHSSGLPAWDQFYLRMPITPDVETAAATADEIERQIAAKERGRPGRQGVYSDLGYILLGRILERVWDAPLEDAVESRICGPLALESTRFVSQRRADEAIADAASTEVDPRRGGVMVGRVHDENCYIQGGVAGHAGLFGTAADLAQFGSHLLAIDRGAAGIVSQELLQLCWSEGARGGSGHYLGGWDTPSGPQSSAGRGFAPSSTVGHLGFTGTSLWIEREAGVVAALLTNRVYPTRENDRIKALRVAFHESLF